MRVILTICFALLVSVVGCRTTAQLPTIFNHRDAAELSSLTAANFVVALVAYFKEHPVAHDRAPMWAGQSASSGDGVRWFPALVGEAGLILSDSTLTFAAGPRLVGEPSNRKFQSFGQFLVGGLHFSGENGGSGGSDFILMPGGGVLIPLTNKRYRVSALVDFPIDFFAGTHEVAKRFIVGIAIPIGAT